MLCDLVCFELVLKQNEIDKKWIENINRISLQLC